MTEDRTSYEVHDAEGGAFYWTEVAGNGETLSTSETYTRKESARDGAIAAAGGDADRVFDRTASAGE